MALIDTYNSLKRPGFWVFTTWFKFLIRYRRTFIGPLWILASPLAFIFALGALLIGLSDFSTSEFAPHLACGLVIWTLIGGYITRGPDIFKRNRGMLLQGNPRLTDLILMDNAELVVHFLHQTVIIVGFCLFFDTVNSWYAAMSIVGLLITINAGYWLSIVLSILGARFKDVGQFTTAIVGIAFLATPIIWMPANSESDLVSGRASVLNAYMDFNPFYHFLTIIRAPLLGNEISLLTWKVVGALSLFLVLSALILYRRNRHSIVLWVL